MSGAEIKHWLESWGVKPVSALHRNRAVVQLRFRKDDVLIALIKSLNGRWSRTMNCWYLPRDRRLLVKLVRLIAVKKGVSVQNAELQALVNMLELKSYSASTIRSYGQAFSLCLDHFYPATVASQERKDIENYLLHLLKDRKYSEAAVHTMINALKFYLEHVVGRPIEFYDLPRPQKPLLLPKVLGEGELERLFNAVTNRKQKAILFTAYSAGLRVSEVVRLRIADVDTDRMQLFISRSKGKKDRYVPLSVVLRDVLRSYLMACTPRPKEFLFEGMKPGVAYSSRSAQLIFREARRKAEIRKEVSFHALRHSFATHLLEKGIDIRYIKDLLGHFNIHTTERYLHVKREQLVNIISPLDSLWQRGGLRI